MPSDLLRALTCAAGPSLDSISLVRPCFWVGPDHYLPIVKFNFSTLRNLTYRGSSEILTTLSKASNLEYLCLNTVSFSPDNGRPVALFECLASLPRLQVLVFSIQTDISWLTADDIMAYLVAQKTLKTLIFLFSKWWRANSPWDRWSQTEKDEVYHLGTSIGVAFSMKVWE